MQTEVAEYRRAVAFGRSAALRQTKGDGGGTATRETPKPETKVMPRVSNTSAQKQPRPATDDFDHGPARRPSPTLLEEELELARSRVKKLESSAEKMKSSTQSKNSRTEKEQQGGPVVQTHNSPH
jgi:hypothetical protein